MQLMWWTFLTGCMSHEDFRRKHNELFLDDPEGSERTGVRMWQTLPVNFSSRKLMLYVSAFREKLENLEKLSFINLTGQTAVLY